MKKPANPKVATPLVRPWRTKEYRTPPDVLRSQARAAEVQPDLKSMAGKTYSQE